jgi:hypothetical protein
MGVWYCGVGGCGFAAGLKLKKRKEKGYGNLVEKRCRMENNRTSERIETNR